MLNIVMPKIVGYVRDLRIYVSQVLFAGLYCIKSFDRLSLLWLGDSIPEQPLPRNFHGFRVTLKQSSEAPQRVRTIMRVKWAD